MTFSLAIFLYAYYVFLALWAAFFLAGIYHMLKYGFKNFLTFFSTFVFIAVAVIMLLVSLYFISQIEWDTNIFIFKGFQGIMDRPMPF